MTTKRQRKTKHADEKFLEKLIGGPLTLGGALSAVRESEEESLAVFAERLAISRTHLSDIEHGRRSVSPERASRFAKALKQNEAQFVRLALLDQIRSA